MMSKWFWRLFEKFTFTIFNSEMPYTSSLSDPICTFEEEWNTNRCFDRNLKINKIPISEGNCSSLHNGIELVVAPGKDSVHFRQSRCNVEIP